MILAFQTPQPIHALLHMEHWRARPCSDSPGRLRRSKRAAPHSMTGRAGPTSSLAFEFCLVGSIGSQKAQLLLPALTSVAQTTVRKYVPPVRRQQPVQYGTAQYYQYTVLSQHFCCLLTMKVLEHFIPSSTLTKKILILKLQKNICLIQCQGFE